MKKQSHNISFFLLSGDILLLNLTFYIVYKVRFGWNLPLDKFYLLLLVYFNVVWLLLSLLFANYNVIKYNRYARIISKTLQSIVFHFFSLAVIFVFVKTDYFSRLHLGFTYLNFTLLAVLNRALRIYLSRLRYKKGIGLKKIVIIGYGDLSLSLEQYFKQNLQLGYQILGFFDEKEKNDKILGTLEDLKKYIETNQIDEIYCSVSQFRRKAIQDIIHLADNNLIRLKMLPNFRVSGNQSLSIEKYGNIPIILNREEPLLNHFNLWLKRSFDIAFSSLVIIFILSWLVPIIALIIRINSKGPIFFIQKRSGKDNKKFDCIKFRTMYYKKNAGFVQAKKNDSRITSIGKVLRKTNLDELPQFFNVFMGDMTIVGPRPHPIELDENFKAIVNKYMVRHFVKPGITGLAQVRGYRGETKDIRSMINRIRMDIFYIENWSFWLDMKIILLTIFSMLRGGDSNAY